MQHHPDTIKKKRDESRRKHEENIKIQADKISECGELKELREALALKESGKAMRKSREVLRRCISAAGNPDPAEGCRIIIEICQEELNKE